MALPELYEVQQLIDWQTATLNRIDDPMLCEQMFYSKDEGFRFCSEPEYHPFSRKCLDHTEVIY